MHTARPGAVSREDGEAALEAGRGGGGQPGGAVQLLAWLAWHRYSRPGNRATAFGHWLGVGGLGEEGGAPACPVPGLAAGGPAEAADRAGRVRRRLLWGILSFDESEAPDKAQITAPAGLTLVVKGVWAGRAGERRKQESLGLCAVSD